MWPAKENGELQKMYTACCALKKFLAKLRIGIDGGKDSLSMSVKIKNKTEPRKEEKKDKEGFYTSGDFSEFLKSLPDFVEKQSQLDKDFTLKKPLKNTPTKNQSYWKEDRGEITVDKNSMITKWVETGNYIPPPVSAETGISSEDSFDIRRLDDHDKGLSFSSASSTSSRDTKTTTPRKKSSIKSRFSKLSPFKPKTKNVEEDMEIVKAPGTVVVSAYAVCPDVQKVSAYELQLT